MSTVQPLKESTRHPWYRETIPARLTTRRCISFETELNLTLDRTRWRGCHVKRAVCSLDPAREDYLRHCPMSGRTWSYWCNILSCASPWLPCKSKA